MQDWESVDLAAFLPRLFAELIESSGRDELHIIRLESVLDKWLSHECVCLELLVNAGCPQF
jgi:hypothetical protein